MSEAHQRYVGELAADAYGSTDERPPLVLVHGLSYDRRQWKPLLRELEAVDPGRRVLTLDLPGHGGSPRRDSYQTDEIAQVIHEAVTDAGLESPIMVGHSLGGVLATIYAARYPTRGAVNIDQPLLVGGFGEALRQAEPVLRGPAYHQVWETMLAGMHIELLPPAARELVRTATTPRQDLLLGYWHEVIVTPAEEITERRTQDLDTIHSRGIAYRYVTGEEPNPRYRRWLESTLPDIAITVLPGSGHFPHLARPGELARILAG
ncbi:alpha/beta fold hydrolase [Micromonospora sp. NPDC050417]|uniref:alpha/beta fold hydrolase n=1 Tax=Micromonospora sp. NPDC050417 TaxID=3364280 RepID=UPI003797B561